MAVTRMPRSAADLLAGEPEEPVSVELIFSPEIERALRPQPEESRPPQPGQAGTAVRPQHYSYD